MKVFIADQYFGTNTLFPSLGMQRVETIPEAEIVVLTGGSDINPQIYGQQAYGPARVHAHAERDVIDIAIYNEARSLGKKVIGICRGAQLMHVMNGGTLWQDVNNHTDGSHMILDHSTQIWHRVTSFHHQQMRLTNKDHTKYVLVASASEASRKMDDKGTYLFNPKEQKFQDVEVVYYPETKSLCYQGHPEFGKKECTSYFLKVCDRFKLFTPVYTSAIIPLTEMKHDHQSENCRLTYNRSKLATDAGEVFLN